MWQIIFQLVMMFIAYMLAPKPKSNSRPATIEEYTVNTADADRVYPILFGTYQIQGANVCWYGDYSSIEIKQKVKSGFKSKYVGTGQYRYFLGWKFSLGYGTTELKKIKTDEYVLWERNAENGSFSGYIDKPNVYGDKDSVIGSFNFYDGQQETSDPYLKTEILSNVDSNYTLNDIPAWHGMSYFVFKGGEVGTSKSLRSWSFICSRTFTPEPFKTMTDGESYTVIDHPDYPDYPSMNPAYIIYDIITNSEYGCGETQADIDLDSFLEVAKICKEEGWGLSIYKDQYGSARDLINEILKYPNLVFNLNKATNKFELIAVRDDYDYETLPILNEKNVLSVVSYTTGSIDNKLNEVKIRWTSFENFKQKINQFQNEGVRFEKSSVSSTTIDYLYLNNSDKAQLAAQREAMPLTTDLSEIQLDISFELAISLNLKKGDVFRFSFEPYGFENKVYRIKEVQYSEGGKKAARVVAMQDTFGLTHTSLTTSPDSSYKDQDFTLVPMDLKVMTAPLFLAEQENKVIAYGKNPKGFIVNYDLTINNQYDSISGGFTPFATTTESIIKTDKQIKINTSFNDFQEYTISEMQNGGNFAMIVSSDGLQSEIITFKNAVFENGSFILNECFRGCSDTLPKDFDVDSEIWFLHYGYAENEAIDLFNNSQYSFKALTKTQSETIDSSLVPSVNYTITNRRELPIIPAGLKVNGEYFGTEINLDDNLSFSWHIRNINNQIEIKDYTVNNESFLEVNSEYVLRIKDSNDLLVKEYIGNDSSFVYDEEDPLNRLNEYNVELFTRNGLLNSFEKYEFTVNRV